jgi:hypothetical protein
MLPQRRENTPCGVKGIRAAKRQADCMSENDATRARAFARDALDELLAPNASIESVVRKAMRVAALRRHAFWRAWLQLQLIDLTGDRAELTTIKTMLDAAFPDERVSQDVAQNVFADYTASRESGIPGKIDGRPITEIEQLVQMAALLIQEGDDPGPKIFERVQRNRQVLSRVKNRIQQYLSEVESESPA